MTDPHKTPIEAGVIIDHELQWVEKEMRLDSIRPFERNPRNITEKQYEKLKQSLIEDGYHSRMKVTHDGRLIGGHQRLRALRELGYFSVQVLMPTTEITDEQYIRIMFRDNHNNGTWNIDMLANEYDLEWLRQGIGLHEVQNIAPFDSAEQEPSQTGGKRVRCPQCCHEFPVKGNAAAAE